MTILPPDDKGPTRPLLWRFVGGLLMAIGGVIALLSGLCSAVFVIGMLVELFSGRGSLGELLSIGLMVLIVGGVPFAIGFGLFVVGRNARRGSETPHAD